MQSAIRYYNRYTQKMEEEAVFGERFLRWTYGTALGKWALEVFFKRAFFSKLYGAWAHSAHSKDAIARFIRDYSLDMSPFVDTAESFDNFNAFFTRTIKKEARPIASAEEVIVFPADGRHLVLQNIEKTTPFFIKGERFCLKTLLQDDALAEAFEGGRAIFSRLCPVDYHRFHFPVSGKILDQKVINGPLYSVNPLAMRERLRTALENKRVLTVIESSSGQTLLMVEIGATCVGSIRQTHPINLPFSKGDEKGFFEFGGSMTLLLFRRGAVRCSEDLETYSAQGYEVYGKMGDVLGVWSKAS